VRKSDGSLGHTVYRKPTHTNRYLNAESHHHPAQLASVANTLATRSKRLADKDHATAEMKGLREALQANGYANYTINKAFNNMPKQSVEETTEDPISTAFLPYVRGSTDRISRLLRRHNIKTVFKADRKISSMLRGVKDAVPNESHGIYEVPCGACERTYVGRTNRKISARIDEHRVSVRRQETTSALALHVLNEGHWIDFDHAKTLVRLDHERPRIYREAIEIHKRPHSLNTRDDALRLPAAWKPALTDRQVTPSAPPEIISGPPPARVDRRRKKTVTIASVTPRQLRSTRPRATQASAVAGSSSQDAGPVQTVRNTRSMTRARAAIGQSR
jgi:hypothetical protein